MATLVIRNVEDELHARLKAQAMAHSRSMEEEIRLLLRQAVSPVVTASPPCFGQAMRAIFEPIGGLELPAMERDPPRDPPDFTGPEWEPAA